MSINQPPDAGGLAVKLLSASALQVGGDVQGDLYFSIENADSGVDIRVLSWMGATPPDLTTVQTNGILIPRASLFQTQVTVGSNGDSTVRPRFYGCAISSDQSAANTVPMQTRR